MLLGVHMATPASVRNHPLHPMLIVFPLALWTTGVIFDIYAQMAGSRNAQVVAFYNIGAGIVGALAAAVPGFIDYFTLKGPVARVGTWHMSLNLVAVVVFTVSWLARTRAGIDTFGADSWLPTLTGIIGLAIVFVSGWLGGSMVYKHGVGVEPAPAKPEPRGARRAA
jgi:uncharacterized membrane protein